MAMERKGTRAVCSPLARTIPPVGELGLSPACKAQEGCSCSTPPTPRPRRSRSLSVSSVARGAKGALTGRENPVLEHLFSELLFSVWRCEENSE